MRLSYREMASGVYHGDLENNENANNNTNIQDDNDFGEIVSLILLMKKLKNEMKNCKDKFEKINIIARYIDQI